MMLFGRTALVGIAAAAALLAPAAAQVASAAPGAGMAVSAASHDHNATGWTSLGKWKQRVKYHYGDVVRYKGKAYVAMDTNKGKRPKGSKHWNLVVANGSQGIPGPAGTNGINGTNGTNGVQGIVGPTGAVGPNWVVKDRAGTTLGVYAGSSVSYQVPLVSVFYDGGLWTYTALGTYFSGFNQSAVGGAATSAAGYFMDNTCQGTAYVEFGSQEMADIYLGALGGSMFRLVGASAGDVYFGGTLPLGTAAQVHSGSLWYWDSGLPGTPGTCEERTFGGQDQFLAPLTNVPLPPASVGGLYVTQP